MADDKDHGEIVEEKCVDLSLEQIFDNCLHESTSELENCYQKIGLSFSAINKIKTTILAIREDVNQEKIHKEKMLEHSLREFNSIMQSFTDYPSDTSSLGDNNNNNDGKKLDVMIPNVDNSYKDDND